jgi:5-carboxymethyl-2-hydroxymuconate isomerase
MAEDVTKQLAKMLTELKKLMEERRERVLQLQAEIDQIEKENSDMQTNIEAMLKDF